MELTRRPVGNFFFTPVTFSTKSQKATSPSAPLNELEGRLSVAATYTVIGYFLPNHLERMKRSLPKLLSQLFELNREAIEEGLLSNRYDIAVLLTSNVLNLIYRQRRCSVRGATPLGRLAAWRGAPLACRKSPKSPTSC